MGRAERVPAGGHAPHGCDVRSPGDHAGADGDDDAPAAGVCRAVRADRQVSWGRKGLFSLPGLAYLSCPEVGFRFAFLRHRQCAVVVVVVV